MQNSPFKENIYTFITVLLLVSKIIIKISFYIDYAFLLIVILATVNLFLGSGILE